MWSEAEACQMSEEVEHLGHIITRHGVKTNPALVAAVREFPVSKNAQEVHRFLGMASYYRRFIPLYSKVAQSLHVLTRQNVQFHWDEDRQKAFEALKRKLVGSDFNSCTLQVQLETLSGRLKKQSTIEDVIKYIAGSLMLNSKFFLRLLL